MKKLIKLAILLVIAVIVYKAYTAHNGKTLLYNIGNQTKNITVKGYEKSKTAYKEIKAGYQDTIK